MNNITKSIQEITEEDLREILDLIPCQVYICPCRLEKYDGLTCTESFRKWALEENKELS